MYTIAFRQNYTSQDSELKSQNSVLEPSALRLLSFSFSYNLHNLVVDNQLLVHNSPIAYYISHT